MLTERVRSNKGNYPEGVLLITPKVFEDERGFFYESWNNKDFSKIIDQSFLQDNHSKSLKGVLRGLHYQLAPHAQGKLVRCTKGSVFDVAVDLRLNSNTYKEWVGVELNEKNKSLLWIPEGFAHGYLTLSEISEFQYKTTDHWYKEYEKSITWNDPFLQIKWPINNLNLSQPKLSYKDKNALTIDKAEKLGFIFI